MVWQEKMKCRVMKVELEKGFESEEMNENEYIKTQQ